MPKGFFVEAMSTGSHREACFSLIFLCQLWVLLDLSTDGTLGRGAPSIVHLVFGRAFETFPKRFLGSLYPVTFIATPI